MVSGIDRLFPNLKTAPATTTSAAALTGYFNDASHVFSLSQAVQLGNALSAFENETSNQIVVAVYPRVPHDAVEQFTIEEAERSRLGRKGLDNGAILFLFMAERVARFEIGYGLEAALTDADSRRILETNLLPAFAKGNYAEGLEGTLAATFKNVKDAYRSDKMPGMLAVYWLQLKVKVPKLIEQAWPALTALETEMRVAITFFAGLLGIGVWDGFNQSARLVRNFSRGARNLVAGRAFSWGMETVGLESIVDTFKVFGLLLAVIIGTAGLVIVAAGGTFGGAGAQIHW
jgi:uncharacterized membrane protein YgcG